MLARHVQAHVLYMCMAPDALLGVPGLHFVSAEWVRGRQRGMRGRGGGSKAGVRVPVRGFKKEMSQVPGIGGGKRERSAHP